MVDIEKREKAELDSLAQEINEEHRAFIDSLKKTVERGIRCGELLTKAKAECKHGTWLPWLEENFEGSERTAQDYMRLYNHRDEIRAKTRDSADLSISRALKAIAASGTSEALPPDMPKEECEIMERAVREFPGLLSLPNLSGLPPERRRGFVAEKAWSAMVFQGRHYAQIYWEIQEEPSALTPELGAQLNEEAQKLRWWVERVEWIETLVRASDWPPGRGMPKAAFDDEKKHLTISELYHPYEDRLPPDDSYEVELLLSSPRASIREFCGRVV
jgi:hypothetical protein